MKTLNPIFLTFIIGRIQLKKFHVLLFLILLPFLGKSQFKTTFASNGDPLSEIVDPSAMKQGVWNYYDYTNKLIRTEKYKDHVLLSRDYFIKEIMNTSSYIEEILVVNKQNSILFKELQKEVSGEIIINQKGETVGIFFYKMINTNNIEKYTSLIKSFLDSRTIKSNSLILTF
ncbi:MAG: hypothetical protein JKY30_04050 [Flavobacteriales bacterium]|nr:hypothetical protein [Flavobacteriales bacterium]